MRVCTKPMEVGDIDERSALLGLSKQRSILRRMTWSSSSSLLEEEKKEEKKVKGEMPNNMGSDDDDAPAAAQAPAVPTVIDDTPVMSFDVTNARTGQLRVNEYQHPPLSGKIRMEVAVDHNALSEVRLRKYGWKCENCWSFVKGERKKRSGTEPKTTKKRTGNDGDDGGDGVDGNDNGGGDDAAEEENNINEQKKLVCGLCNHPHPHRMLHGKLVGKEWSTGRKGSNVSGEEETKSSTNSRCNALPQWSVPSLNLPSVCTASAKWFARRGYGVRWSGGPTRYENKNNEDHDDFQCSNER